MWFMKGRWPESGQSEGIVETSVFVLYPAVVLLGRSIRKKWTPFSYQKKTGLLSLIVQDKGGWTALMWAMEKRVCRLAPLLVERGADVNILDEVWSAATLLLIGHILSVVPTRKKHCIL